MLRQEKKHIENSPIFYLFLILISMNFLGHGSIFCVVFFLWYLLFYKFSTKFDATFYFVLLLSISIMLWSLINFELEEMIKGVNYIALYFVGMNAYKNANQKVVFLKRSLFSIFLGFSLFNIITYFYNMGFGFSLEQRTLLSFWTKEPVAVTLIGLTSSIVVGYSFYGAFIQEKVVIKLITLITLVITVLLNFITATRTPLILLLIVWCVMFIIYFITTKGVNKVKFLTMVVVLFALLGLVFITDMFGVKTYILSLPIWDRFEEAGFTTSRWEISKKHFQLMFDYIFGGSKISEITGSEAHNFIQQTHNLYGIFALLFVILVAISIIIAEIKLIIKKKKNNIEYILMMMYACIFIQIMLEPVLTGYPILLWLMLFVHGATNRYLREGRLLK